LQNPTAPNHKQIKYEVLFQEDENYDQGPFLEGVRDQYLAERHEYLIEVERQLQKHSGTDEGPVMAWQCTKAIRDTDPKIPEASLWRLMCAGFRADPKDRPGETSMIERNDFMKNIRRMVIRWHTHFTVNIRGFEMKL